MTDDYGKKVGKALQAVGQLHIDTSRLLRDCDGVIGNGKQPVFGNRVTDSLTKVLHDPWNWMAASVYRYYYDPTDRSAGVVEGVTIYFLDDQPQYDEPLLLLGQLKYTAPPDGDLRSVCKCWDIWSSVFEWSGDLRLQEVIVLMSPVEGRIEWSKVFATPLYSIRSVEEVGALMEQVRAVDGRGGTS